MHRPAPAAGRELYGVYYLQADYGEECYGGQHTRYRAVAALFVAAFPVGIACGFWAVLWLFRVPQLAAVKERAAVLRASTPPPRYYAFAPKLPRR